MTQSIKISAHSSIYTLFSEQTLDISLEKAWDFFSSPKNLAKITPSKMGFKITSGEPEKMFPGQIISYKIKIFPFISSKWITEITQVKHLSYFIDEQRFGPYKMWHHEHHFIKTEKGTKMTDKISYKIPFGFFGRLVHSLFIKKKLIQIFSYRSTILEEKLKI